MGRGGEAAGFDSPPLPLSHSSTLLFDAVGTLFYADPPVAEVYEAHAARHGVQLSRVEIAQRFRAAFAAQESLDRRDPQGRTSDARERRRWQAIVAETFVAARDTSALFDDLWNHFARPESWRLFDDARPTIDALLDRVHVVGIASNFDARLRAIVAAHLPRIDEALVFVSSALGHRKPAREFFAACEAQLAARCAPRGANEFILVGDDLLLDYDAARAAGWRSILLDRSFSENPDRLTRKKSGNDFPTRIHRLENLLG